MTKLLDQSYGEVEQKTVAQLSKLLARQPAERIKVIEALEHDFLAALDLLFDIKDVQIDALRDLQLTGMDKVISRAISEALRRGYDVEFRTQAAGENDPPVNLRLEVDSQRPSAAHRPNVTIIVWCVCRF
jgi:serine/threonine protein kinase